MALIPHRKRKDDCFVGFFALKSMSKSIFMILKLSAIEFAKFLCLWCQKLSWHRYVCEAEKSKCLLGGKSCVS